MNREAVKTQESQKNGPSSTSSSSSSSKSSPSRSSSPLPRLAVLVSGSGSNLQAMIDAKREGRLDAEIALVLSNRPQVKALERAARAELKSVVIDHRDFATRQEFDQAVDRCLSENKIEWIALAGFMRLLGAEFVRKWRGKLVNIHPSLLPAFPGARALEAALEAGVPSTGVSVHFVDEGTDTGPVIAQKSVPILPNDTLKQLQERVQKVEHHLYPLVIQALVTQKVWMEKGGIQGNLEALS